MRDTFSISPEELAGAQVIIDIDGTLVVDDANTLTTEAMDFLRRVSAVATVYLNSNGPCERTERFAREAGVHALTGFDKPDARLASTLPSREHIVVIGDKWHTDERFARNIGAKFIKVPHVRGEGEPMFAKIVYVVDDFVAGIAPYVEMVRPHQWVKNILVFAPLFFAGAAANTSLIAPSVATFFSFCLLASAVYLFNDCMDRAADAQHPLKRSRPLPSGRVDAPSVFLLAFGLFAGSMIIGFSLGAVIVPLLAYAILNVLYSTRLKHVVGVDLVSVASMHVLRVVAGGMATALVVSPWIVLCTFFGALFLVVGKRRGEFRHDAKRKVLLAYSKGSLDALLIIALALSLVSYSVYAAVGTQIPHMLFSVVFVAVALFRMLNIIMGDGPISEYPERMIFKDRVAFGSLIAWVAYVAFVIYTA